MKISLRQLSLIGLITCISVLAAAVYLEYEYMLATCPLCILQRIVFAALAVVFLIGAILPIRNTLVYVYSSTILFFSSCGLLLAARQIWLQYFAPPQEVSCAASLSHLIDIHPFLDALKIALIGSGECAAIDFTILGLSIAGWSFLLFLGMALVSISVMSFQKKRQI